MTSSQSVHGIVDLLLDESGEADDREGIGSGSSTSSDESVGFSLAEQRESKQPRHTVPVFRRPRIPKEVYDSWATSSPMTAECKFDADYVLMQCLVRDLVMFGQVFTFSHKLAFGRSAVEKDHHGVISCCVATSPVRVYMDSGKWLLFCKALQIDCHLFPVVSPPEERDVSATSSDFTLSAQCLISALVKADVAEVLVEFYGCKMPLPEMMQLLQSVQQRRSEFCAAHPKAVIEFPTVILDVSVFHDVTGKDFELSHIRPVVDKAEQKVGSSRLHDVVTPASGAVGNVQFDGYPLFASLGMFKFGGFKVSVKVRRI